MERSMAGSILLLDPYRSALMTLGIEDGFLALPRDVDFAKTPMFRLGSDECLQTTVLQFLLLFDDMAIVQHEERGSRERAEEQGLKILEAKPLEDAGLVRFTSRPVPDEKLQLLGGARDLLDMWRLRKDELDTWEPVFVPQLIAKGALAHPALYRVWREVRIGTPSSRFEALSQVPAAWSDVAHGLLSGDATLDLLVFTALNELSEAEAEVEATGCRVAQGPFRPSTEHDPSQRPSDVARDVSAIFRVSIDALLDDELSFPLPSNLEDAKRLRSDPNIVAFRELFQPWIQRIAAGDCAEVELRKEVRSAVRAFRNAPRVKKLNDIVTYVSLPLGLVPEPAIQAVGFGLGLASLGLPKLADRWQRQGKWVAMCRDVGAR